DEFYVTLDHPMSKTHFISFLAAVSDGRVQLAKLYPEGPAEARFGINGTRYFFVYFNRHGLFVQRVRK
ncbi:MAG: XRE family transcriptional regulator, partial [Clostridia bacterium]|nr:XRE family transcriptional regulator [Clostridia bacterium]